MIKERKYKKKGFFALWLILSLIFTLTVSAQNSQTTKGAQISDGTVFSQVEAPLDFSILELNSKEKGFLLPRMNTAQRNSIPENNIQSGLMIFNTDEDCMEFYNSTRKLWLSLCGSENEPAEFDITATNCSQIAVVGNYVAKVYLNPKANIITMRVNVSVPGTYQIEADAYHTEKNEKNGYTFYAKGRFPAPGTYNVVLKGTGTPTTGYAMTSGVKGDRIEFVFNGNKVPCVAYNMVDLEGPSYDFTINQVGKIYQGVDITTNNNLLVATLSNIKSQGRVEITSTLVNGMRFKGTHILTSNEVNLGKATVKLIAEGASLVPVSTFMVFNSNSLGEFGSMKTVSKNIEIEKVGIAFMCNNPNIAFKVNGDWELNKPFSPYHSIDLPIQVLAPGKGEFELRAPSANNSQIVVFKSGIVDLKFDNPSSIKHIRLFHDPSSGLPSVSGKNQMMVTFTSKGAGEYGNQYPLENITAYNLDCPEYVVNVKGKAEFNFSGSTLKFWSQYISKEQSDKLKYMVMYFPPKMDMSSGAGNIRAGLTLRINVTSPGEYDFSTQEINGIKFVAKGITDKTGVQDITLQPEGKSLVDMPTQTYRLYNGSQATNLTVGVDFVYQPMKIYTFGAMAWHPGGNHKYIWGAGPTLVRNSEHFGWDGKVRIDGITFKQSGPTMDDVNDNKEYATDGLLKNTNTFSASNLVDVDVVIIGGTHSSTNKVDIASENLQGLANYIKNNNGAVIYGESDANQLNNFFGNLGEQGNSASSLGSKQGASSLSSFIYNPYLYENNNYNLIIGSKFGQNLAGKLIGPHDNVKLGIAVNPMSFTALAGANNNAFVVARNKGGLIIVGNNNFMGGKTGGSTSNGSYPTVSNNSRGPSIGKSTNREDIYNSWFLLNLVHWSIDYAQEQRNKKY